MQKIPFPCSEHCIALDAVERLEEAKHINKSLGALGDALSAVASKSSEVPLNANKLTEALTPTLGGMNCKCILIVHIAPEDCFRGESLSSLMYGQMVSALKDGHVGYKWKNNLCNRYTSCIQIQVLCTILSCFCLL